MKHSQPINEIQPHKAAQSYELPGSNRAMSFRAAKNEVSRHKISAVNVIFSPKNHAVVVSGCKRLERLFDKIFCPTQESILIMYSIKFKINF